MASDLIDGAEGSDRVETAVIQPDGELMPLWYDTVQAYQNIGQVLELMVRVAALEPMIKVLKSPEVEILPDNEGVPDGAKLTAVSK